MVLQIPSILHRKKFVNKLFFLESDLRILVASTPDLSYNTFYGRKLASALVSAQHFHPSLVFAGKTGAYLSVALTMAGS